MRPAYRCPGPHGGRRPPRFKASARTIGGTWTVAGAAGVGLAGAGPVPVPVVAGCGEPHGGERVATVEDGPELLRSHRPLEAQVGGQALDPPARAFTPTRVVVLGRGGGLAQVVVGGAGAEPPDVQHEEGSWFRSTPPYGHLRGPIATRDPGSAAVAGDSSRRLCGSSGVGWTGSGGWSGGVGGGARRGVRDGR